jgi:lysophospholipase L1-like esterase
MRILNQRAFRLLPWVLLLAAESACSGGADSGEETGSSTGGTLLEATGGSLTEPGSGGASSGGVTGASGGAVGSGGASLGTGGAPASGGAGNSGGQATGGDTAGTGGVVGTGGEDGTGGVVGVGGTAQDMFEPCPAAGPCKILPLGDSITVGWGSADYSGYRVELFRKARDDGHDVTFTGTKEDGPGTVDGVPFPRKHEGVASQTITQIQARIDGALAVEIPHIVLVHAGTNDVNFSPDGVEDRLPILVDKLLDELPDALIVVASIVPFPQFSDRVSAYNATIPGMLQERIDAGAHVLFVDQFAGYPAGSELPDGVHPNEAGYERMATKWYDAIQPYLR